MLVSVGAWAETLRYVGTDTDWQNPNNWQLENGTPAGRIPTGWKGDSALIPSGKIVVMTSNDQGVKSITVESGAVLTCNCAVTVGDTHGGLYIGGAVIINGGLSCDPLTILETGSLTLSGQATIGNTHGGLDLRGSMVVGGGLSCNPLVVSKTASLSVGGSVTVGNNAGSMVVDGSVNIGGSLQCSPLTLNSGSTVKCGGDLTVGNGNGDMNIGGSLEVDGNFKLHEITVTDKDGAEVVIDISKTTIQWRNDPEFIKNYLDKIGLGVTYLKNSTWQGNKSSDWFDKDNWNDNTVPTEGHRIVIPDGVTNAPIIYAGGVAVAREIKITGSKVLTLKAGAKLDAKYVYITKEDVAGMLVIENDYRNMSSLRLNSYVWNNNGTKEYNKVIVKTDLQCGRYTYMGSATREGVFDDGGRPALFKVYDINSDSYVNASSYSFDYSNAGEIGKGGSLSDTWRVQQTGTIKPCGIQSIVVPNVKDYDGELRWNVVSNPFSFGFPLAAIACPEVNNVDPVIWFYGLNSAQNAFAFTTYSLATHVGVNNGKGTIESSSYIAPMQAFFVRPLNDGVGNLTMYASEAESYSLGTSSLKSERVVKDVLRLVLESDGREPDEMALVFRDGGAMDCVFGDAEKMSINVSANQIYGVKSSKRLAIPFYPTCDEVGDEEIAIGFSLPSNVKYGTIRATNVEEFMSDVDVYLVDKVNNEVVDLREVDEYQFEDIPGVCIDDRFSISLKSLNVSEDEQEDEIVTGVFVAGVDEKLGVSCVGDGNVRIALSEDANDGAYAVVYDVYGRVLARRALVRGVNNIRVNGRGVFVVEAVAGGVSKKVKVRSL